MRKLRITIDVPIVDLSDDERAALIRDGGIDPEEGLPTLEDYVADGPDAPTVDIAHCIMNAILYEMNEGGGEMFAGSDVYVTTEKDGTPELVDATWI